MNEASPAFPPLFAGEATASAPFATAAGRAAEGCDAGLILWRLTADRLEAAMVLAPEVAATHAAQMLVVGGVGLVNAFGALAPPEVGMRLAWDGGIDVNGAACGALSLAMAPADAAAVPNWLVVGYWLPLLPASPDAPGDTPQETSLFEEGCADLDPRHLLEAWARHTLVWINRWEDGETAALHAEWTGLALGIGEDITAPDGTAGRFLGVDEHFAMLLKTGGQTRAIPLTALLKDPHET